MLSHLFLKKTAHEASSIEHQIDQRLPADVAAVLAGAGVPTLRQALPRMQAELDRARRYGRPLAVLVISCAAPLRVSADTTGEARRVNGSSNGDAHGPVLGGSVLVPALVASVLREMVREVDLVSYAPARMSCVIVLPEVGAADAIHALVRVRDRCLKRLMFPLRAGIAVFPDDGWIFDELFALAGERAIEPEAARSPLRSVAAETPAG
jgi:hypothetical protein